VGLCYVHTTNPPKCHMYGKRPDTCIHHTSTYICPTLFEHNIRDIGPTKPEWEGFVRYTAVQNVHAQKRVQDEKVRDLAQLPKGGSDKLQW